MDWHTQAGLPNLYQPKILPMILYISIIFLILVSACTTDSNKKQASRSKEHITTSLNRELIKNWDPYQEKYGVEGCFILHRIGESSEDH